MDAKLRNRLQAAGWRIGDAADFLGMNDQERQLLDARLELAMAIRRQRQVKRLSQKELGDRLHTSQPRVAKIERAARDVSLDQLVRAFAAAGGKITVRIAAAKSKRRKSRPRSRGAALELEAAVSHS